MNEPRKAVVLFSGGQDSTTSLIWAMKHFDSVAAISFAYNQRHAIELQQAQLISKHLNIPHLLIDIPDLKPLTNNALIQDIPIKAPDDALPNTFVPGRNLLFLTLAATWAYTHNYPNIVLGVSEADYSGYPDCREPFIHSAQQTLSLAMDFRFSLHTPLIHLNKAQIWLMAKELGALDMIVNETHTCYMGVREVLHPWGYGCSQCPACLLRKNGFYNAFPLNKQ